MADKDNKDLKAEVAEEKAQVAEEKAQVADEKKELRQEIESKEAIEEEMQEEIRNFAETSPEMGPNSFWGASGSWWILGIAGILIVFLVIWVCFFYGPN